MKKRYTFLALSTLLIASCGNAGSQLSGNSSFISSENTSSLSSSIESSSLTSENKITLKEEMLQKLSVGYEIDLTIKQIYNNIESITFDEVGSKNDQYYHKMFLEESKKEVKIFETYSKDNDGFLVAERRTISNSKNFSKVLNPATSEYYKWADGYDNAFKYITINDFKELGNNKYNLDLTKINEATKNNFATQLYGNPGLNLTKLEVTLTDESITSLYAECDFTTLSSAYKYEINGVIVNEGENAIVEERAKPFDKVEDVAFTQMISALKNYNYTLSYEGINADNQSISGKIFRNDQGAYYEITSEDSSYNDGYLIVGDSLQEVVKENESYVKFGDPVIAGIEEVDFANPAFALARECFDLKDNKYILKDDVEGDISEIYSLESISTSLYEFTIEFKNDSYVFTNTTYDNNGNVNEIETVTFTDINNTLLPFDENSLSEPENASSWEELLDVNADFTYQDLETQFGELMLALPLVENHMAINSWTGLQDGNTYILVSTNENSDLESDLLVYLSLLMEYGFEESVSVAAFGGHLFTCEPEVNGEVKTVNVEVFIDGQLCIAIY